jgi:hypothetical protein
MTSDGSLAALIAKLEQWSAESTANFKATFHVSPGRWLRMEAEHGTLGAYKLILTPQPREWWVERLTPSYQAKRLRWTVEAVALNPEFVTLFTDEERAVARERLDALGYDSSVES